MIIKFTLLFGWILCSLLEGCRDSFFYHYRMNSTKPDKYNIHWLFTLERGILLSAICFINSIYFSTVNTIIFTSSLILIFSFFHNGMYFTVRHLLDKTLYPKKWFDNSTSSTATIELSAVARAIMMAIGLIGIISTFQFN